MGYYTDHDNTNALTVAADELFQQRMHAAFAAGGERRASAAASVKLKPAPYRPKKLPGATPQAYGGSSAGWAVLASE